MLNITINKLVILTGLFFLFSFSIHSKTPTRSRSMPEFDFNISQNYFTINEMKMIKLHDIKQILQTTENSKTIFNFEKGNLIHTYTISQTKRFIIKDKFYEQNSYYDYDEKDRLIKLEIIDDISHYKSEIVYDIDNRIFSFKEYFNCINSKDKYCWTDTIEYNQLSADIESYKLLRNDSSVFILNQSNKLIKTETHSEYAPLDSIVYEMKNDTSYVYHYSMNKSLLDTSFCLYNKQVYYKDLIIKEMNFYNLYNKRPILDKVKNYYYENNNLTLIQDGYSTTHSYRYDKFNINNQVISVYRYNSEAKTYFTNSSSFNKVIYKKEDLKSMF